MSALTSPAASPVALPAKVASPSVLAPGVPSLAAFIDLMIGKLAPPAAKPAGDGDRQAGAESGKSLPDKAKHIDPTLAWLVDVPSIPAPQPIAVALPAPTTPAATMTADAPIAVAIAPTASPLPDVAIDSAAAADDAAPKPIAFTLSPAPRAISQPATVTIVAPQSAPPAIMPPSVAAALPALFALAMTPYRAERDEEGASATTPTIATLAPSADTGAAIAPAGDAQRQTLDLGRQDWPQKMIDHIEALRDNADATDTAIRLRPEALGRVDVSLRTHSDGAISVRFAAEQPTTRTLLLDAAPQLTAAAEARGIRLSGTSVDLGGDSGQRQRPDVERPQTIGNHLAASNGDDSQTVDDGRIA